MLKILEDRGSQSDEQVENPWRVKKHEIIKMKVQRKRI